MRTGLCRWLLVCLCGLAVWAPEASGEMRVWTDVNGAQIDARLAGHNGDDIVLEDAGGRQVAVPLSSVSRADQAYVRLRTGDQPANPASFDSWLADYTLWEMDAEVFMGHYRDAGLRWVEQGRSARSVESDLRFRALRIWELLVRFDDGSPVEVTAFLYNRGDAGDLASDDFEKMVEAAQRALSAWSGQPPGRLVTADGPSNTRVYSQLWTDPPHQATLAWTMGRARDDSGRAHMRPEFLRLRLEPIDASAAARGAPVVAARRPRRITAGELRANVSRAENGDVLLADVPMVDQGEKGYCAAAVAERVLRYYGHDFDQHQVAQLADTTAASGTSAEQMTAAVQAIGHQLGFNLRHIIASDVRTWTRLINDYNRQARRANAPEISIGRVIHLGNVYRQMNLGVLRETVGSNRTMMDQFDTAIQEYISRGVPLMWSVQLGLVAEDPALPQAQGGHMRLIIGYNASTGEILYSDSWGPRHALKRMALVDARMITTGLSCMLPHGLR